MSGFGAKETKKAKANSKNFKVAEESLKKAIIYHQQKDICRAEQKYREAIQAGCKHEAAYTNLGVICKNSNRFDEAIKLYKQSIKINDRNVQTYINLGILYRRLNEVEKQKESLRIACTLKPNNLNCYIMLHSIFSKIPRSEAQIDQERRNFDDACSYMLDKKDLDFEDNGNINLGIFGLAYHNKNDDKALLEKFANALRNNEQLGSILSSYCEKNKPKKQSSDAIKVGIVSDIWGLNHPVTLNFSGIIEHLVKTDIDVEIITGPSISRKEKIEVEQRFNKKTVELGSKLAVNCKIISERNLDMIIYPDIGMTNQTYLLAMARLAPVQVVLAGHPCTTGLDTVDYFLSNEIEVIDAQDNYTEQLIRLSTLSTSMTMPKFELAKKEIQGLDKEKILIGIPHSLFKLTEEFEQAIDIVAESENNIQFILCDSPTKGLANLLRERWQRTAPTLLKKSIFFERLEYQSFLCLLSKMDIVLDTFGFGAATVFFQAMALGKPVVTMPNRYLKGRTAAGGYQQMKVSQPPIANSKDEYIKLLCNLIRSKDERDRLSSEIKDKAKNLLFDNQKALHEHEQFIREAIKASRKDKNLYINWKPEYRATKP